MNIKLSTKTDYQIWKDIDTLLGMIEDIRLSIILNNYKIRNVELPDHTYSQEELKFFEVKIANLIQRVDLYLGILEERRLERDSHAEGWS